MNGNFGIFKKKMSKLREITEGWWNFVLKQPTKQAKERLEICKQCDKPNKLGICTECGCYILAKVQSSKSVCPLKKWNDETHNS